MKSHTLGEYISSVTDACVLIQRRLLHIPLKKRERLRVCICIDVSMLCIWVKTCLSF